MGFHVEIELVTHQPFAQPLTIQCGRLLTIDGWVADLTDGTTPAIVVRIDDSIEVQTIRLPRPDIAKRYDNAALTESGFNASVGLNLVPGSHTIAIGTHALGGYVELHRFEVSAVDSLAGGEAWPRIIVAANPKSGSSYTHNILTRYFKTIYPPLRGMVHNWEHNLDSWFADRLRHQSFVIRMHIRPYHANVAAMSELKITPVVCWRNIADTIVSLDDHLRRFDGIDMWLMNLEDKTKFEAMNAQERYAFLIRWTVPWLVNFYTGWRKNKPDIFVHYEQLAVDPYAYFTTIIGKIAGQVDDALLRNLLGMGADLANDQFNAGVNGRANEKMSVQTKALLEETLRAPFIEDIEELVRELPWNEGPAAVLPTRRTYAQAR